LMQMMLTLQQKAPLVQAGDLSAGLWQALLATAAGLAVAIPAYAGYNLLLARVDAVGLDMERAALELENYFLQNSPAKGPA
ncbi:MAG: MotA/TolQ/ExbB proton channel family protein, partial [Kiritimatiellaeota bacterium]|nr:MotA/TolQ/ExbB proton channel family protein [Kiritimatiellota bacterium]